MSTGISEVYTWPDALPADADERPARGRARRGVSDNPAAAAQSAGPARIADRVAVVSHVRGFLRRPPGAAVLRADAAARIRGRRRVLSGVDQRAPARVAVGAGGGGGVDLDVAEPARL